MKCDELTWFQKFVNVHEFEYSHSHHIDNLLNAIQNENVYE